MAPAQEPRDFNVMKKITRIHATEPAVMIGSAVR
jgi:hypothetical protein